MRSRETYVIPQNPRTRKDRCDSPGCNGVARGKQFCPRCENAHKAVPRLQQLRNRVSCYEIRLYPPRNPPCAG